MFVSARSRQGRYGNAPFPPRIAWSYRHCKAKLLRGRVMLMPAIKALALRETVATK